MAGWFDFPRVPEPEVMDDSGEVQAYSGSAAKLYLSAVDDTFVAHALQLLGGADSVPRSGRALDIGTGPGQIVLKLARRLPGWELIGADRSPNMIREALAARGESNVRDSDLDLARRAHVEFLLADGGDLPFADASFDLLL